MKFEKNKILEKAINNLYDDIRKHNYDTAFKWADLLRKTGNLSLNKQQLYYVVAKTNILLMSNDQKHLVTIQGQGKRIIKPQEHPLVARKEVKKSVKKYQQAGAILLSTNMDELQEDQKKQVTDDAVRWRTLEMFTNEALKKKKMPFKEKNELITNTFDILKLFKK